MHLPLHARVALRIGAAVILISAGAMSAQAATAATAATATAAPTSTGTADPEPTLTGTVTIAGTDDAAPAGTYIWLEHWNTQESVWDGPIASRVAPDGDTGAFALGRWGADDYRMIVIPPIGYLPTASARITVTGSGSTLTPAAPVHLEVAPAPIVTIHAHVANFKDEPGGVRVTTAIEFDGGETTPNSVWSASDTEEVGDPQTGDLTLTATSGVPTRFFTTNVGVLGGNSLPYPDETPSVAHVYASDSDLSAFDDVVLHPQSGFTDFVWQGTVSVTGIAGKGHTLQAHVDGWYPTKNLDLTYQWFRDGQPIEGATSASYVATLADAGSDVTVSVTGAHAGFESSTLRSATTSIPLLVKSPVPVATISGVLAHGRMLTAKVTHAPAGATYTYRWYSAGKPIAGAIHSTYTPTNATVGHTLGVHVTVTTPHYVTTVAAASAKGLVAR